MSGNSNSGATSVALEEKRKEASRLKKAINKHTDAKLNYATTLEILAETYGHEDWNAYCANLLRQPAIAAQKPRLYNAIEAHETAPQQDVPSIIRYMAHLIDDFLARSGANAVDFFDLHRAISSEMPYRSWRSLSAFTKNIPATLDLLMTYRILKRWSVDQNKNMLEFTKGDGSKNDAILRSLSLSVFEIDTFNDKLACESERDILQYIQARQKRTDSKDRIMALMNAAIPMFVYLRDECEFPLDAEQLVDVLSSNQLFLTMVRESPSPASFYGISSGKLICIPKEKTRKAVIFLRLLPEYDERRKDFMPAVTAAAYHDTVMELVTLTDWLEIQSIMTPSIPG